MSLVLREGVGRGETIFFFLTRLIASAMQVNLKESFDE